MAASHSVSIAVIGSGGAGALTTVDSLFETAAAALAQAAEQATSKLRSVQAQMEAEMSSRAREHHRGPLRRGTHGVHRRPVDGRVPEGAADVHRAGGMKRAREQGAGIREQGNRSRRSRSLLPAP